MLTVACIVVLVALSEGLPQDQVSKPIKYGDVNHHPDTENSVVVFTPTAQRYMHEFRDRQQPQSGSEEVRENSTNQCPPWFIPSKNVNGTEVCQFGNILDGRVEQFGWKPRTYLSTCYCMSRNQKINHTVVGACPYTCFRNGSLNRGNYRLVPKTVAQLNRVCDFMNRDGQLCGQCKEGFAPSVYSYDLKCIDCTYKNIYPIIKYIVIAFLPLTLFYSTVVIFRIHATSPAMNGFILVSQTLVTPLHMRVVELSNHVNNDTDIIPIASTVSSIFGIWNLDFFRMVYTPFCLHSKMTMLQTMALDYTIAVYPLILIVITYLMVELYDRNLKIIVCIWRPFLKCFAHFRRKWDIRTSLIDAFATFILLSSVKLLGVSFDLLFPINLFNELGHRIDPPYLYFSGEIAYFGKEHLPYGIVAGVILFIFVILPTLLMCLYPCRCFQQCLNLCRLQCRLLHTFMDAFLCGYKDGTNGTYDCRYFAAIYMIVRTATFVAFAITLTSVYFPIALLMFFVFAMSIALVKPYKVSIYNTINTILVLSLSSVYLAVILGPDASSNIVSNINTGSIAFALASVGTLVPLVYITGLVLYWVFIRNRRLRNILNCDRMRCWRMAHRAYSEESLPDRLLHSNEYTSLLP